MEILTGKPGNCEFPTVWRGDVVLEGWMLPILKHVTKIVGFLLIKNQHYLTSISSILPNLVEVTAHVHITGCNGLVGPLIGFAKLEKVGDYVLIDDHQNLEVLDGTFMPNLVTVGGSLVIASNPNLEVLDGLFAGSMQVNTNDKNEAASNVPTLGLQGNPKLKSIVGFATKVDCPGKCEMWWWGNDLLTESQVCNVYRSVGRVNYENSKEKSCRENAGACIMPAYGAGNDLGGNAHYVFSSFGVTAQC